MENNLLEALKADERFALTDESLAEILDVRKFIGCAPEQTEKFLNDAVRPLLEEKQGEARVEVQINV